MGTHDISRHLFQPRKHYGGVRMQERRALTEADWNEGEQLREEIARRTRVDLIGESGSPDFGWRVAPGSIEVLPDDTVDFALSAGTLYAGGNRLELFAEERFRFQDDWLQQRESDRLTVPIATRQDMVFVLAWQQCVTAAEDAELYEAPQGPGVDASVRVRQMARALVRADVTGTDCDQAWADASADYLEALCTGATLADDGEVLSPIRVTVAFNGETETEDPCAPCVDDPEGGYLAAENQAIRVMIVGDGTQYTWGFDNASPLYRVRLVGTTVEVLNPPTREVLQPLKGETVEILPWSALLDNGEKAAEELGFFTRVDQSFDARTGTLVLEDAPPPGTFVESWPGHPHADELPGPEGLYFFMRVWRRGTDRTSDAVQDIPALGTAEDLGNTGLTVEFSALQGCPGDYWVIAARRNEPSRLVPWDLQAVAGASPHGPRRFLAPLGRILWTVDEGNVSSEIVDCRPRFGSLARRRECATFTVGTGDTACGGQFGSIQAAIDALPEEGGTIHVLPGDYAEHIHIDRRVDVRIRGCGPRTRIVNPAGANLIASREEPPLVSICNSQRIQIAELAVVADGTTGIRVVHAVEEPGSKSSDVHLVDLQVITHEAAIVGTSAREYSQARSAVEVFGAEKVRVEDSELRMYAPLSAFPAVFFLGENLSIVGCHVITTGPAADAQPWGGVQVPGGAVNVTVEDCDIEGGLGHGITLGSVNYAPIGSTGIDLTQQAAVPVGVAAIYTEGGAAVVSLLALARLENGKLVAPVPGPVARRIRVVRNRIRGALTSAIGAAAFWQGGFGIAIDDLTIEDNLLAGNALVPPFISGLFEAPRIPGAGGVSLPAVANLRVVDNRIIDNGASSVDPITGIYVLEGGAVEVSGNVISSNGPRLAGSIEPRRGRRGGVVVMRAVADGEAFVTSNELQNALPRSPCAALIVRGNTIAQPEGKALYAPDLRGDAFVEGNVLSSQGDNVPLVDTVDEVQLAVAILPESSSVLDRRACKGLGAVVYLRNNVRAIDALASSSLATLGSRVGFNANRVLLDWVDRTTAGPQLCAVLIDALFDEIGNTGGAVGAGDVSIAGNQLQAVMHQSDEAEAVTDRARNVLLAHVVALGRTVRLVSNRIAEGRRDAQLSAFVWSPDLSPWASLNAATHCILGGDGALGSIVLDNLVLAPAGTACAYFEVSKPDPEVRAWLIEEQPIP